MRTEPRYTRCKYNNLECKFVHTFCHFYLDLFQILLRFLVFPFRSLLQLPLSSFQFSFCRRCSFSFFYVKSSNICENLTRALAHDCPKARVLIIGALADSPRGCEPVTRRDFCERTILAIPLARRIDDDSLYLRFSTRHYAPSIIHEYARE